MSVTAQPGKTLSGVISLWSRVHRTECVSHGGTGLFDVSAGALSTLTCRPGVLVRGVPRGSTGVYMQGGYTDGYCTLGPVCKKTAGNMGTFRESVRKCPER